MNNLSINYNVYQLYKKKINIPTRNVRFRFANCILND